MKKSLSLLLGACLALSLSGCAKTESATVYAMNTVMDFSVHAEKADDVIARMTAAVNELDHLLSRTQAGTKVSQLNGAGGKAIALDEATVSLLETAREVSAATGGAFDVTIAPVASAWGFTEAVYRVPAQEELAALLPLVDSSAIAIDGQMVSLAPGQAVDLGGIAKGYASDCLADIFLSSGADSGYVSLGGNVLAWGAKENGDPWRIGVKDPRDTSSLCGVLELKSAYAVTSGGYERCFEENGKTYHHIIDPATGYPSDSDLLSVTIVMDWNGEALNGKTGNGTLCDALSTALFVMGEEEAADFWRSGPYDFDMVLVTADGRVLSTPGITFTPTEESGYTYETVS